MKLKQYEQRRLKIIAQSVVGKSVLDIGNAQLPNKFLYNFDCIGYDINKPKKNREIYTEQILGDIKDIRRKLRSRKFDSIICGELIEHLENPYQFLRDLQFLLKDDGRLILSTLILSTAAASRTPSRIGELLSARAMTGTARPRARHFSQRSVGFMAFSPAFQPCPDG